MQNALNDIDERIGKYLAGEASPEEIAFIERWEQASDENRRYVAQFRIIFEKASHIKAWQHFDTDAAWKSMRVRMHVEQAEAKVKPIHPPVRNFSMMRIAASIALLIAAGFFAYRAFNKPPQPVEVVAGTQTKGDTLPDGSGVFLNKETKLTYAFDKKEKTHVVKLRGEAYFNINHEDDKKFLVEADGVFIRDIGTSFNVTAYPDSNTVEVVVEEGEVQFYSANNAGIHLRAGGKGVYDKTSNTFTIDKPEENVTAYKTKFFSFSDCNLRAVVQSLNAVYDRRIVIGEHLNDCHLTVSFSNEDIVEIAHIIAETLNLTVREAANGDILLEGSGCDLP